MLSSLLQSLPALTAAGAEHTGEVATRAGACVAPLHSDWCFTPALYHLPGFGHTCLAAGWTSVAEDHVIASGGTSSLTYPWVSGGRAIVSSLGGKQVNGAELVITDSLVRKIPPRGIFPIIGPRRIRSTATLINVHIKNHVIAPGPKGTGDIVPAVIIREVQYTPAVDTQDRVIHGADGVHVEDQRVVIAASLMDLSGQ